MAEPAVSPVSGVVDQAALEAWGRGVGVAAAAGDLGLPLVIALRGPLGAGKSVLARAVARGVGVDGPMPSPTYNLLFTYAAGPVVVHHLDLYRLQDPDDVWELGWRELGSGHEIVMIEWPDRAETLLPPDRWEVRLDFRDEKAAEDRRRVQVEARGRAPMPPPLGGGES
jgi:tRNA threonylcarbamoyladenosine biosynthesis protein TsaE